MLFTILADIVVIVHCAFVLLAGFGSLLALRWRRILWIQVPAAVWGASIELGGWMCPLTPLENHLRIRGGEAGYSGGFVEYHILPVLYPAGLTREVQYILGLMVIAINLAVYWRLFAVYRRDRKNTS